MGTVNGLPAHILLVHAVVVLLPLAALLLVLTAFWQGARRRLAGPNAILAVISLGLVPLTTDAGEWLQRRVAANALVDSHVELGDTAVLVALPIAFLALVIWWRGREQDSVRAAAATEPATDAAGEPIGSTTRAAVATAAKTSTARRTWLAPQSAAVGIVISVLSVVAAGVAVYDIYRIGDSGAQATWNGKVNSTATTGGQGG